MFSLDVCLCNVDGCWNCLTKKIRPKKPHIAEASAGLSAERRRCPGRCRKVDETWAKLWCPQQMRQKRPQRRKIHPEIAHQCNIWHIQSKRLFVELLISMAWVLQAASPGKHRKSPTATAHLSCRKNGDAITFCRLPAHLLWIIWGKAFFCCDYVSNLVNFQVQKSYHSSPWMGGPQAKLLQQLPNKGWHW